MKSNKREEKIIKEKVVYSFPFLPKHTRAQLLKGKKKKGGRA
jgi:hypothetical protein